MGFLNPGYIVSLKRLDALRIVGLHASENDQAAVGATYLVFQALKERSQPQLLYLIDQELADGLPDGVLYFTDAGSSGFLAEASDYKLLGEEVALGPASPTMGSLISGWRKERR